MLSMHVTPYSQPCHAHGPRHAVLMSLVDGFPELFTFIRDVAFVPDSQTGYAVGQNGLVLRSDDAGTNWRQVFPKPEEEATEVASH